MNTVILAVAVLTGLAALFGTVLVLASRVFHVETDPKEAEIRACLAGANCGGCGYPGCDGYAAAVAKGEAPCNCCVAGGVETAENIARIMGVNQSAAEKKYAHVLCSGSHGCVHKTFNYYGPQDCRAAMLFGGQGDKACSFACVGLGSCAKVCQFGALKVVDGIARVNRDRCVGCGACVDACPKNIIKLLPERQRYVPACSSNDKGADVMKKCFVGCIGCMKCQKECPVQAITVENNLARIDVTKCVNCGHCAEICPRGIIKHV